MAADKKDSVSINICVGDSLFDMLSRFCAITGQSKTVAVERAILMYCTQNGALAEDGPSDVNANGDNAET